MELNNTLIKQAGKENKVAWYHDFSFHLSSFAFPLLILQGKISYLPSDRFSTEIL